MAERVVLHAGLMKTGTSYLQRRLQANRKALRQQGFLFPTPWRSQVLAVSEVLGRKRTFSGQVAGTWDELARKFAEHDGTGLLSMEFFGPAKPDRIARVVDSLGAASGTDVEVVLTLRDLGRGVPAMWQESLKNGGHVPWATYVSGLEGGDAPHAKAFWRQQGAVRIVRNWAKAVGQDHLTIVTVPPPGAAPGLLWDRFCTAAGIDGADFTPIEPANESLGAASSLVLRELNEALSGGDGAEGPHWMDYNRVVKMGMAKKLLPERRGEEDAIGYHPSSWVLERSQEIAAKLDALQLRVVGDLDELEPVAVPGVDPDEVGAEEIRQATMWLLSRTTLAALAAARSARDDDA